MLCKILEIIKRNPKSIIWFHVNEPISFSHFNFLSLCCIPLYNFKYRFFHFLRQLYFSPSFLYTLSNIYILYSTFTNFCMYFYKKAATFLRQPVLLKYSNVPDLQTLYTQATMPDSRFQLDHYVVLQ